MASEKELKRPKTEKTGRYSMDDPEFDECYEEDKQYFQGEYANAAPNDKLRWIEHADAYVVVKRYLMSNLPFYLDGDRSRKGKKAEEIFKEILNHNAQIQSQFEVYYARRVGTIHGKRLTHLNEWNQIFLQFGISVEYGHPISHIIERPELTLEPLSKIISKILNDAGKAAKYNQKTEIGISKYQKSLAKWQQKQKDKPSEKPAPNPPKERKNKAVWSVNKARFKVHITRDLFRDGDPHLKADDCERMIQHVMSTINPGEDWKYRKGDGKLLYDEMSNYVNRHDSQDSYQIASIDNFGAMRRTMHHLMMEVLFRREFVASHEKKITKPLKEKYTKSIKHWRGESQPSTVQRQFVKIKRDAIRKLGITHTFGIREGKGQQIQEVQLAGYIRDHFDGQISGIKYAHVDLSKPMQTHTLMLADRKNVMLYDQQLFQTKVQPIYEVGLRYKLSSLK